MFSSKLSIQYKRSRSCLPFPQNFKADIYIYIKTIHCTKTVNICKEFMRQLKISITLYFLVRHQTNVINFNHMLNELPYAENANCG